MQARAKSLDELKKVLKRKFKTRFTKTRFETKFTKTRFETRLTETRMIKEISLKELK